MDNRAVSINIRRRIDARVRAVKIAIVAIAGANTRGRDG
jgi:hypothetical protein